MSKFQFGDSVKSRNKKGFVLHHSSNVYVAWEDGSQSTIDPAKLELIPHPDTDRLDWLEKNQFELGTYYDDDGLGFIDLRYVVYQPDKQGCRIKLSDEKSYRQAIDKAMQQEQTK